MDRDTLESLAKASLGVDATVRPTDAVKFATLYLAWQSAQKRVLVRDELDAEAEAQKVPKAVPAIELQLYRAEFQKRFYKLKDAECPSKPSFEDLCEQFDSGELWAMSLRHFGSRNEDDEAETGNIQLAKSGRLKIKKAKVETANPTNMEEFRSKIMLMINHFVFARFRLPNKDALKNVSPFTGIEYLNYLCGKDVAMMEAQTVEGASLHRPSLKLVTHYEYQMRKEAMELVNKGMDFTKALMTTTKDDIRERHFSTPLAVSSASQSLLSSEGGQVGATAPIRASLPQRKGEEQVEREERKRQIPEWISSGLNSGWTTAVLRVEQSTGGMQRRARSSSCLSHMHGSWASYVRASSRAQTG